MGAHVSACPNHQTGRTTPLETRAVVAMAGTFGYELDPGKLTEKERDQVKEQIAVFKKYYGLIQDGLYYRLTNPAQDEHYAAWEFADENGKEALLCVVASKVRTNDPPSRLLLRGLREEAVYEMDGKEYPGGALMNGGFPLPEAKEEYQSWMVHFCLKK